MDSSRDYISLNRYSHAGSSSDTGFDTGNLNEMIQTLLMGNSNVITDIIRSNLEPEADQRAPEPVPSEGKNVRDDILTILKVDEERFKYDVQAIIQQEMLGLSRRINESVDETIRQRLFNFFNSPSQEQQATQLRSLFDETHQIDRNVLPLYDQTKRAIIQKYTDITKPFSCFKVGRLTQSENIVSIFTENFVLQERFLQNTWTPANVIEVRIPFNLLFFYKTVSRMVNSNDARRFETVWRSTPEIFLDRSEHLERMYQTEMERIQQTRQQLDQELTEVRAKDELIEKLRMENADLQGKMDGYLRSKQKLDAESALMNRLMGNFAGSVGQIQERYEQRVQEVEQGKRVIEFENEKLKDQAKMLALSVAELRREKADLQKAIEQYQLDREEFYRNFADYQDFKIQKQAFQAEKNALVELRRVLTLMKTNIDREKEETERLRREVEQEHRREIIVPAPTGVQRTMEVAAVSTVQEPPKNTESVQSTQNTLERDYDMIEREDGSKKRFGKVQLDDFFIQKRKGGPSK